MHIITVSLILILWIFYGLFLKKFNNLQFKWSSFIFPIMIVSILLTIDFAVNYVAAGVPVLNDGIALHGVWSFYFFGEENWSIANFQKCFEISSIFSMISVLVFIAATIFDYKIAYKDYSKGDA